MAKSLTAKDAEVAKEERSLTAKEAEDAKENKSFTAKEIIIRSRASPGGREGTAPRVAYSRNPGHPSSLFLERRGSWVAPVFITSSPHHGSSV